MKTNLEVNLLIISLLWFAFVNVAVNPDLGITYIGLGAICLFLYIFDTKRRLELEITTNNRLQALFVAGVTWVIFTIGTTALIGLFSKIDIGGLIRLIGASTPALAQSKVLNFITFAIPIAFVETQLWARLLDFFGSRLKISRNELFNFIAWVFIIAFAFVFMMFHVTSKGVTNNSALITVFLMMVTSYILMFIFRETKQAVLFHIVANTLAAYMIFF